MGTESGLSVSLADLLLAADHHGDDVAVGDRGMHQNAGGRDMRHNGHQVQCLMGRSFLHLQRIDETTVVVAGVCHAANDGDGNLFHAEYAVQAALKPNNGRV